MQGEVFGLPLAEVQEIIRMPGVVRVPMASDTLEGIANLRGAVLPITSLRRIFGMADMPHDDATRVVVVSRGSLSGIVVDRMASVITTEPDEIEPIDNLSATIRTDLLSGIVKRDDGTIMLLDPPRLDGRMGKQPGPKDQRTSGYSSSTTRGPTSDAASDSNEVLQLVSFEVANQEYAFPIADVQEIVQAPAQIRPVPRSDAHVLGVMTLRSRLLPLVSLRRMFNLPQAALEDHNRIVVVTLHGASPDSTPPVSVGIVMDSVNEVLRVARSLVEPVPPLLVPASGQSEMVAICRLDADRLVTILSPEKMFPPNLRAHLLEGAITVGDDTKSEREPTELSDSASSGADTPGPLSTEGHVEEEQFVVFRLAQEEFGLPIGAVQEIVRIPEHLTRVPRSPAFIEGVVNLRGVVLPVVDQRRRFGLPEMARCDRQRIIVLMVGEVRTGFIVDSVTEVLKVSRAAIGPAPDLSEEQKRLIDRVANLQRQRRMLLLMRPARLLSIEEQGVVAEL
jgi:purine-binding chemotaxis protein CheW